MNFGQNSEIQGLDFCANMKLRTRPVKLANCLKIIDHYAKDGGPGVV